MPPVIAPSDYLKYRGMCKEMSQALVDDDPSLQLVRGHYWCPIWNTKESHWWCVKPDGTIVDPTAKQFPSQGQGDYIPWDGVITCSQCGKVVEDSEAIIESRYAFCSGQCYAKCVGLI